MFDIQIYCQDFTDGTLINIMQSKPWSGNTVWFKKEQTDEEIAEWVGGVYSYVYSGGQPIKKGEDNV